MKPTDRQKMCPNCDGRIPYDATQCPYCFKEQEMDANAKNFAASSSDFGSDPFTALYPIPSSSNQKTATMTETTEAEGSQAIPFWPILMLSLGSNLLTIGILQFFFSDHGVLRLEMNASYWFLMVLVAIPLIYFGLKNFSSKDAE